MRKQIAAANWKMNLTYQQGEQLLKEILQENISLKSHQHVVFAVPFPYLVMANGAVDSKERYDIAAQNCSNKASGAYTGETSAEMLYSIGIRYCVIGHSERREYFHEDNKMLAEKLDLLLTDDITPIFCCGEPLDVRERNGHEKLVKQQVEEALFHLDVPSLEKVVVAYEPVWAIGTGKTASSQQAQDMHAVIRRHLASKFGQTIADKISICIKRC